jgi:ribosome-binding factor A
MASRRTERLGTLIAREISGLLVNGLKNPDIGFATIGRVDVTEDLSYAKVRVSVMGTEAEKAKTLAAFKKASGFIRSHLAKNISTYKMPEVQFVLDESLDHAMKIEGILSDLRKKGEV